MINEMLRKNNKDYQFLSTHLQIFPSKKHTVVQLNLASDALSNRFENSSSVVIKIFDDTPESMHRWQNEIANYDILDSLDLPGILPKRFDFSERIVIYEYIHSQEYRTLLLAKNLSESHCINLGNWFRGLHEQKLTFFDSRLSNFMVSETDKLVIIDYEDIRSGDIAIDLAKICSSFLDYTPGVFDDNFVPHNFTRLIDFLLSYFLFDRKMIKFELMASIATQWTRIITEGLTLTAQRRGYAISVQTWEEISTKIRSLLSENISIDHP